MSFDVTLRFPSEKARDIFWGYFLDGGGDEGVLESLSMEGLDCESDWDGKTKTIEFKLAEGNGND